MKQLLAVGRVRGGARQPLVRWMALAIIIVPAVALAIAVGGVTVPAVGIACWLVGAGLLGAIKLVEPRDRRAVGLIVGSAIALRLALGAVLLTYFRDPLFVVFDDAQRYLEIGGKIGDGWRAGSPPDLWQIYGLTVAGYYYVVAILRYVVGPDEMTIIAF